MRQSKEEVTKELESVTKILGVLRARQRILREQTAQYGNMAPPHILTELEGITEQIRNTEEESEQLEIQSVEDQLPLNEIEYRLELARAWNTPEGYPKVEGFASLELKRLLLKIPPGRAVELEREIREALAEERIVEIGNTAAFDMICRQNDAPLHYGKLAETIKPLIFLHRKTTLRIFELYECNWGEREFDMLFDLLMRSGNRVAQSVQGSVLKSFVEVLKTEFYKPEVKLPQTPDLES
jgi:hypothetical protein